LVVPANRRRISDEEVAHFFVLTEHFFRRFFNNEFLSRDSESRLTVSHILALLVIPGIVYTVFLYLPYDYLYWHFQQSIYDRATAIDQCRFVIFSMVVIGFLAVLEWDGLFPDGRDYAALMPLPVRPRTLFAGKIAALGLFLGLFAADLSVPSALFYPTAPLEGSVQLHGSILYAARMFAAHIVGIGAASVFAFLFFLALQGLLINSLSYRIFRRISVYVQVTSLVILVLLLSLIPLVSSLLPAWVGTNSRALFLLPPMWFLGLYKTLLGSHEEVFRQLAHISLVALELVLLVSAATYLVSYKTHVQKTWEFAAGVDSEPGRIRRLFAGLVNRLVFRKPLERAAFYFVSMTIFRSARHRLYLATYLGVGIALTLLALGELFVQSHRGAFLTSLRHPDEALLSIPLILSFFILSGMRMVFAIPAELPANWVFQITEDSDHKDCLSGVRKAMVLLAVLPLFVLLFPIYTLLWGAGLALLETAFGIALGLALVDLLLLNFRKIPFTCSYLPEKTNFIVLAVLYWLAFTTYGYTAARLEYWMLRDPVRWITGLAVTAGAVVWLMVYRNRLLARGFDFLYEEEVDPAVRVLGLN
jgi:hypothetical protein